MNIILFTLLSIALLLLVAAIVKIPGLGLGVQRFANTATILVCSITHKGAATYLADATFGSRYLLAKFGSDASHMAIAGAADYPFAVVPDMTPLVDQANSDLSYPLKASILGIYPDTVVMQASAAIAIGADVVPAANGQIKTLPTSGGGTTYIVGRAKTSALAAGDLIEIIHCKPNLVTIAT